jgi:hypothetical protein
MEKHLVFESLEVLLAENFDLLLSDRQHSLYDASSLELRVATFDEGRVA